MITDESVMSYFSKWEFLKFKIWEYAIHFGILLNGNNKLSEMIIKEINTCCNKTLPTDNDKVCKLNLMTSMLEKLKGLT